ncbi:MAG: 4Fe-4S ferredoxin, partial [Bryobacteraceae bacterium]
METDGTPTHPSRRLFTIAAASTAASWIMTACGPKRLYEAPKDRLRAAIKEMEAKYSASHGKKVTVSDAGPMSGVEFAYALDISRCIGCRRCVYACVAENNQSRDPQIQWIRVMSMEKEKGVDFSHANA